MADTTTPAWCLGCGGRAFVSGPSLDPRASFGVCVPAAGETRKRCEPPSLVTLDPREGERALGARLMRNATRAHGRHDPSRPNPHCTKCTTRPASSGRLMTGTNAAGTSPAADASEARHT